MTPRPILARMLARIGGLADDRALPARTALLDAMRPAAALIMLALNARMVWLLLAGG